MGSDLLRLLLPIAGLLALARALGAEPVPERLNPPVTDGIWVRPAEKGPAQPVIGFKDGIKIVLWPDLGGPRGLIRIHAPYVYPKGDGSLINFIAIEPVVKGARGLSELEWSALDSRHGKRFWFVDDGDRSAEPRQPWECARGKIGKIKVGGVAPTGLSSAAYRRASSGPFDTLRYSGPTEKEVETLSIVIMCEGFDNGARPRVTITFRSDRPNEVSFKTGEWPGSAKMERCVLTATMGNLARARYLWLRDEVIDSRKLWPDYAGDGFVGNPAFPASKLMKLKDGSLMAATTPSEKDLSAVRPAANPTWYCPAKCPTQYWRKYAGQPGRGLGVVVNGRFMYWASRSPIPGGVAFENFEMVEDYKPGAEFCFGVSNETPEELGWPNTLRPTNTDN